MQYSLGGILNAIWLAGAALERFSGSFDNPEVLVLPTLSQLGTHRSFGLCPRRLVGLQFRLT
jgi:hypothetical protein